MDEVDGVGEEGEGRHARGRQQAVDPVACDGKGGGYMGGLCAVRGGVLIQ